ncbi:MAG: hypothetical protein AAFN59_05235 [Pseudomonadota bacterium]
MSEEKTPRPEELPKKQSAPATHAPKDESPSKDEAYTFRDWASI